MPLTDLAVRNVKAGAKPVKMADGGGMYLYVTPAGGKLWRFKYRIAGREKLLAMGGYPEVGLGEARRRREALVTGPRSGNTAMVALRFRSASPTASHGAGGSSKLTDHTDHSVGAGQ